MELLHKSVLVKFNFSLKELVLQGSLGSNVLVHEWPVFLQTTDRNHRTSNPDSFFS